MADKIRGITIEIGGDTSGLTKSLKKSNGEIKSTKSQLKDVDKLLKLDPTNIDLLRQREQLLNKEVDETSDKLQELKKVQAKMDENGVDKNSEQYMALQREIISTSHELDDLRNAARDSNATLSQVGAVADKVADKTGKMASATAGLSGAAAGVLALLGKAGLDMVAKSDDLNTAANQTGFSTRTIQQIEYASDRIDVSFESIVGSAKKMKAAIFNGSKDASRAFKKLGVAVKDQKGNFRDTETVFWETVEALGEIEDPVLRDKYAMAIFGKSADELAGIVDDGGKALRDYGEEAEDLGLILDQETLDALNATNDQFDKMKAMFKGVWAKTGARIMEKLAPVFEKLAEKVEKVVEWISNLSDEQIWKFVKILGAIAVLSPALKFFSKLASAVSTATKVFKFIKPAISAVNAVLMANPIILIIAAVVALIAVCVKFRDQIIGGIDKIHDWLHSKLEKDWTKTFGPVLGGVLNKFSEAFLKFTDKVGRRLKNTVKLIHGVFTGDWDEVWGVASETVQRWSGNIKKATEDVDGWMHKTFTRDWTEKFGNRVGGWMNKASEKILTGWDEKLKPGLNDVTAWLDDTFSGDWDHAWSNIKQAGIDCWDKIKSDWGVLETALGDAKDWVKDTWQTQFVEPWNTVKDTATGAWTAIKDGWEKDGLKGSLDEARKWVSQTFGDDWARTWADVKVKATNAWTNIKTGWDDAKTGVKSKLESASTWLSKTFSVDWGAAWDSIKDGATDIWDKITDCWDGEDGLKGKLEDAWKWLNDTFYVDWQKVWDDIVGYFSDLWASMSNIVKAPLNAVIGLINDMIDKINWLIQQINKMKLPFVGTLDVGEIPHIPLLARGGTVLNGSAIVGEAGPELLTVKGGRTTVTPLTGGSSGATAAGVTIYTQQMTEAQVDYILNRVNRGLGAMA